MLVALEVRKGEKNMSRKYLAPVHVSPETAFVVEDYPYGFRLRCKKRTWIEKNKKGMRLVSQTTDPRRALETWNKPKASTYQEVAVLYIDEATGHLEWDCLSVHAEEKRIAAFETDGATAIGEVERKALANLRAVNRAYSRVSFKVCEPGEKGQTIEQQARFMGALIANEKASDAGAPLPCPKLRTAAMDNAAPF